MNPRINYNLHSPDLMKKLFELSQLSSQGTLGRTLADLVHIRASQLNGCAFCLDMHVKEAKIHGERELRLYHISIWREFAFIHENAQVLYVKPHDSMVFYPCVSSGHTTQRNNTQSFAARSFTGSA